MAYQTSVESEFLKHAFSYDLCRADSHLYSNIKIIKLLQTLRSYDTFNQFRVSNKELRKQILKRCIILFNNQHRSFTMTANVIF